MLTAVLESHWHSPSEGASAPEASPAPATTAAPPGAPQSTASTTRELRRGGPARVGLHQAARGPDRRQAVEAEQTTASGLVIPDTAKEKPQEGEVLAVGPGRVDDNGNRVPLDVAVGDKVIYSKYGGTEVKYGGEELLILSARDVLAVVG